MRGCTSFVPHIRLAIEAEVTYMRLIVLLCNKVVRPPPQLNQISSGTKLNHNILAITSYNFTYQFSSTTKLFANAGTPNIFLWRGSRSKGTQRIMQLRLASKIGESSKLTPLLQHLSKKNYSWPEKSTTRNRQF